MAARRHWGRRFKRRRRAAGGGGGGGSAIPFLRCSAALPAMRTRLVKWTRAARRRAGAGRPPNLSGWEGEGGLNSAAAPGSAAEWPRALIYKRETPCGAVPTSEEHSRPCCPSPMRRTLNWDRGAHDEQYIACSPRAAAARCVLRELGFRRRGLQCPLPESRGSGETWQRARTRIKRRLRLGPPQPSAQAWPLLLCSSLRLRALLGSATMQRRQRFVPGRRPALLLALNPRAAAAAACERFRRPSPGPDSLAHVTARAVQSNQGLAAGPTP